MLKKVGYVSKITKGLGGAFFEVIANPTNLQCKPV